MVKDIRLIKNWGVTHFQDTLMLIFGYYVKEDVLQLLEEQPGGELPAKLEWAAEELVNAIVAMREANLTPDIKSMSAEIKQKDEERDNQLRGVKQMVAAMLRLSPSEQMHAAAVALQQSIDDWKLDPKQAYVLESTMVTEWLKVVAESDELTTAARLLGLTDSLRRLGELCAEVNELIYDRTEELTRKESMQQRQRRKDVEACWRTFVAVMNAAAVLDPDEQRYDSFIRLINYELKNLRHQMRHTRQKNPRKGKEQTEE